MSDKDRELFEDILANTISKKIRGRIHASKRWVETMAVFSAKVTGNPHFFDEGTLGEKLLSSYLRFFLWGRRWGAVKDREERKAALSGRAYER